ncbi:MAG: hypothetical protein H6Q48_131, partial [Deltaproteobacteria bacterium]|nr:hypothetical protein [Deltaproteobacteria bacterium]
MSLQMSKGGRMDDWCDQEDWVSEGERVYRCTKCGKRLYPRE